MRCIVVTIISSCSNLTLWFQVASLKINQLLSLHLFLPRKFQSSTFSFTVIFVAPTGTSRMVHVPQELKTETNQITRRRCSRVKKILTNTRFRKWKCVLADRFHRYRVMSKKNWHFRAVFIWVYNAILHGRCKTQVTCHRSHVTGHCFTYTESILNDHKSYS